MTAGVRDPVPARGAGAAGDGAGGRRERLRAAASAIRQAYHQVFGIPDYDRYLAHHATHHAGQPVLSRRHFVAQAIERKYQGKGPRCC